jgi:hypothetical protein
MKQVREAKEESRAISGRVESVRFSPSPGAPQEEVQKKDPCWELLSKHTKFDHTMEPS